MGSSTIISTLTLRNTTANLSFNKSQNFSSKEEPTITKVATLDTSDTAINLDTIESPRYFAISHEGDTGSILVGFDGINYDQEVAPGDLLLVRLRNTDKFETATVTTVADSSANLDATYFTLEGESGTWAVWIDVDASGTAEPVHGQTNAAKISSIVTDNTAAEVALAIVTDLQANEAFAADFTVTTYSAPNDDLITITNNFTGARTNLADTGLTGFAVATTQEGAAGRSVYAKSSAGLIDALIAIMPN